MSFNRPMTIGVCAVGGPEYQPPSPGERTRITVTVTYDDGHTDTRHHVWVGYTPAEAYNNRLARLREARARVTTDRATLTITVDQRRSSGAGVVTETLTFVPEVLDPWQQALEDDLAARAANTPPTTICREHTAVTVWDGHPCYQCGATYADIVARES